MVYLYITEAEIITYHRAFLLLWPVVLKFGPPGINFSAMVENIIQTPGTQTTVKLCGHNNCAVKLHTLILALK